MPDLLSAVVFLPTLGALLLMLLPADQETNLKAGAIAIALATFIVSLFLLSGFAPNSKEAYQFALSIPWIPRFGIKYAIGLDGISIFLILLTTFLTPLTLLGAWTAVEKRVREFVIAMLLLESGMLGAFVALDLFLFYVFWEAMLIPMYFLIGIWGGRHRLAAAIKFFLFTMAGSLLMLIGIIYVAQKGGTWDFSLEKALSHTYTVAEGRYLFFAFFLAFAIKVPLFPVHTWLPDAHTEAPTAGSVILAGVLLKLGVYGMIRFAFPMFPMAAIEFAPLIAGLSVIGVIYGAIVAWVQPDMKKLVAYSSVSHLGFCTLGLAALTVEGVTGSVYQMLAHGMSTGALFMLVGILYERRHTRMLADYGGIARQVPRFAFVLVFVVLASAGMPALSGFPGEFLILLGTFTAGAPLGEIFQAPFMHSGWLAMVRWHHVMAVAAALGVILAAVYLLHMVQKVLFGPLHHRANEKLADINLRETLVLAPMLILMVVMGVRPGIFLEGIEPAAKRFVAQVRTGAHLEPLADSGNTRTPRASTALNAAPQLKLRPADLPLLKKRFGDLLAPQHP